jgi:hypothetical protein
MIRFLKEFAEWFDASYLFVCIVLFVLCALKYLFSN